MGPKTPHTVEYHGSATYSIEGYRIQIRWETACIGNRLRNLKNPNFLDSDESPDAVYTVIEDGESVDIYRGTVFDGVVPIETLAYTMERKIQLEVATHAPEAVFVHAGVVRWQDQAVVIPGRTYSGKSTLTYALCQAGAGYYSDEYAVVDKKGEVRPWPRAITLRGKAQREQLPAKDLGWQPNFGPVPVRLVLVAPFEDGAEWSPQPISSGQAILSLLENTVTARIQPERALNYLRALVEKSECLKSNRGEADETARRIIAYLATNA